MPRAAPEVVDILTRWLDAAKRGEIVDVFVVGRGPGGDYTDDYAVSDVPDMLIEVRSASIRARVEQCRPAAIPATDATQH
jgi:hypothetical protein